jgi:hypothetical protein
MQRTPGGDGMTRSNFLGIKYTARPLLRALGGLAALTGLSIACTSASDFNNVTGPADDAGAADGNPGSDGKDAGQGTPDGGSGEAGVTKFCDSLAIAPTFCDDFDTKPIADKWEGLENSNGLVTNDALGKFLSSPAAMAAKSSAIPKGGTVRAVAKKAFTNFNGKPVSINVSFDVFVEAFDPSPDGLIAAFALLFGIDKNYIEFVLNLHSTGTGVTAQVTEAGENPDGSAPYALHGPFPKRPKVNDWTNIRLEFAIQNTTGTGNLLHVFIDGEEQFNGSLEKPLKSAVPRMELGSGWAQSPAAPWVVRYDNFVADLRTLQ